MLFFLRSRFLHIIMDTTLNDDCLKGMLLIWEEGGTEESFFEKLRRYILKVGLKDYSDYDPAMITTDINIESPGVPVELLEKFREDIEECVTISLDEKPGKNHFFSEEEIDFLPKVVSLVRLIGVASMLHFVKGNVDKAVEYVRAILKIAQKQFYSDALISVSLAMVYAEWAVEILSKHLQSVSPEDGKTIIKELEHFTTAGIVKRLQYLQTKELADSIRWYVSLYPESCMSDIAKSSEHRRWKDLYSLPKDSRLSATDRRLNHLKAILLALEVYERQQTSLREFLFNPETKIMLESSKTPNEQGIRPVIIGYDTGVNGLLSIGYLLDVFICVLKIHCYTRERRQVPIYITAFLSAMINRKLKKYLSYRVDEDRHQAWVTFTPPVKRSDKKTWLITASGVGKQ